MDFTQSVDMSPHRRHWSGTGIVWSRSTTILGDHWQHLRTTNPVESPFASLRLRTDAAKRYKRAGRAIAVIWKMLMVVERRFRRLNAPELTKVVYIGEKYEDGAAIQNAEEIAA